MSSLLRNGVFYRVWVGRYARWTPRHWSEVPPEAEAIEPADSRLLQEEAARQVVEGFNRQMLRGEQHLWAIAVPVQLRVDGEPRCGQTLRRADGRNVTRDSSNRPSARDKR